MNLNGNMLASIDVETTGLLAGVHEIVQIGLVPLDGDLNPCENHRPFYHHICPQYPENAQKAKRIVPLAHNWAFERAFLLNWLGPETFDQFFFIHPRDTQIFGACINDAAVYHGKKIPFNELSLTYMCRKFGIHNERSHDALADSLAGAKLYQELILGFGHK
jgi:DNA polymerase III epsilon subunit-like protein